MKGRARKKNLIIEILNLLPLNALSLILFLLAFDGFINENLLQFLVHKVDAELFERVRVKDFETVNIENADCLDILLGNLQKKIEKIERD